jgi:2,3-dihydroxybenzoate-AMP ligase
MQKGTHKDIIDGWHPFTNEEIDKFVSKGFWHGLTVCDCLDRNVERFPNKLAVVDDTTKVTWKGLKEKTNRLAVQLKRLGVGYGEFFVLQLLNVVEFFYMYFALNRIGAIPVMCLPRHRRLEIDHEIALHEAKGICIPSAGGKFDYVAMVEEIRQNHAYLKIFLTTEGQAAHGWHSVEELLKGAAETDYATDYLDQFKPDPNDICTELLSGGTTGVPKGIPRTHNDYICGWDYVGRVTGYTVDSVGLIAIPAAHNAAMENVSGPLIFRGATIVLSGSSKPENHFRLVEKYRITHTLIIPVQIMYWMEGYHELSKKYDLSSLKVVAAGGQKVRPELVEWCIEELGVDFVNTFGMAEGPQLSNRWDSPKEVKMYTVGRPIILDPEVQIRLVDDNDKEVKRGQVGEMVMKGPLTFKGYFRADEENKKTFDEQGFMHSGDLMSIREDGSYVVEGRKKDTILRGGENVYPERIEDRLKQLPKVANCAAIGMPDPRLGERLCAIVQPIKGEETNSEEIIDFLNKEGIAIFELPERVEIVGGWPLTAVNKIDKRRLRAYITAKLFEEDVIDKKFGDEYLKRDKVTIDDVLSGRIRIEFTDTPL